MSEPVRWWAEIGYFKRGTMCSLRREGPDLDVGVISVSMQELRSYALDLLRCIAAMADRNSDPELAAAVETAAARCAELSDEAAHEV